MRFIEIPEFPRLRGEKAIKALHDFINELVEQIDKELTDKHTTALIKLAKGLIYSIKAETRSNTSERGIKEKGFVTQIKKIMKYIPESFRTHEDCRLWKSTR